MKSNLTARPSGVLAEQWITVREAARRKGVSVTTIRNWINAGRVMTSRMTGPITGISSPILLVCWVEVERIEPAYGPGRARRT